MFTLLPRDDVPVLADLKIFPPSVVGGNDATGAVTLGVAAPAGGQTVALATVPSSIVVPTGETAVEFPIQTIAVTDPVISPVHLNSASIGTWKSQGFGSVSWFRLGNTRKWD